MFAYLFEKELGLNIGIPVSGGAGNTNDGNTARKFFRYSKKTSSISGINLEIIERLCVLLDAINSGFILDAKAFTEYALDTARKYVNKYPWFYMPVSMHILLIHGGAMIRNFHNIPLGALSEEAQESKNKEFKHARIFHTRKTSMINCNQDLLQNILASSDPKMATINLNKQPVKKENELRPVVKSLFLNKDMASAWDEDDYESENEECASDEGEPMDEYDGQNEFIDEYCNDDIEDETNENEINQEVDQEIETIQTDGINEDIWMLYNEAANYEV